MQHDHIEQPSTSNYTLSILGALGSLLLFLFIIFIAYLPNRPEPVNAQLIQQRTDQLATIQAEQKDLTTGYSWINQEEGVVRIPVEQAKRIVVNRLNEK